MDDQTERRVFGHNGVGRFGMFCFANTYYVETWKDGLSITYKIVRTSTFDTIKVKEQPRSGSGTRICCRRRAYADFLSADELISCITSKFFDNHLFKIKVNGIEVDLSRGQPLKDPITTPTKYGDVVITRMDVL